MLSTWSSGTGGAGIIGAFSYAALIAVGLSEQATLLLMTSVPILQLCVFWFLLRPPQCPESYQPNANGNIDIALQGPTESLRKKSLTSMKLEAEQMNKLSECERPLEGVKEKLRYMPSLLKYIIPLVLVFLSEYLINSGLVIIINPYPIFVYNTRIFRYYITQSLQPYDLLIRYHIVIERNRDLTLSSQQISDKLIDASLSFCPFFPSYTSSIPQYHFLLVFI